MDRNPFHLAHTAATGASQPGLTVPDEFHEVSLGGASHAEASRDGAGLPAV